jgi:hypothetical protein
MFAYLDFVVAAGWFGLVFVCIYLNFVLGLILSTAMLLFSIIHAHGILCVLLALAALFDSDESYNNNNNNNNNNNTFV